MEWRKPTANDMELNAMYEPWISRIHLSEVVFYVLRSISSHWLVVGENGSATWRTKKNDVSLQICKANLHSQTA